MERKALRRVIDSLPHYSGQKLEIHKDDPSFIASANLADSYVWPDVTIIEESAGAPVILVTAPGAGGKSAAARAIAHVTGTPLIDLSKLQVGSNTLMGLLPKTLGFKRAGEFIAEIRDGSRTLVLDGLDEARLLAGRDNFVAFINNLCDVVVDGGFPGQLVILGRKDAVGDAYLLLLGQGIEVEIQAIQPLNFEQGCVLIDKTLDGQLLNGVPYKVHRTYVEPWQNFRNSVFADISSALGAQGDTPTDYWPEVEDFLGYPPVLLALSETLLVENPSSTDSVVKARPGSVADENRRGALLRQIVESILDRESGKARSQCAKLLSVGSAELGVLYGREEQVLRILRVLAEDGFGVIPPASLPAEQKKIYEDHIEGFVLEHPFLLDKEITNVVFADYIRAFVSTVPAIGAAEVSMRDLLSVCRPPGPFYAHFMYDLSRQASPKESSEGTLNDEGYVGDIIRSHIAGSIGEAMVSYVHRRKGGPARLELTQYTDKSEHADKSDNRRSGHYRTRFIIENPAGILELPSPLSRCLVSTVGDVILAATNGSVQVGPLTVFVANELSIEGEHFTAIGMQDSNEGVAIFTRRPVGHNPQIKITNYPEKTLVVGWPEMWFQWKRYEIKSSPVDVLMEPRFRYQIMFWLRRILTSMKGSARFAPSVYYELLDKLIIGADPIGQVTLRALVELRLVERHSSAYRLNLDELAGYEVNYAALRGVDFQSVLEKLFAAVAKSDIMTMVLKELQELDGSDDK